MVSLVFGWAVPYRLLADLVVCLHLGFVLFVLLGGFAVWRWRWVMWVHLPAVAWGTLVELADWYCPLTALEDRLLRASGAEGYSGSFIGHYLLPVLYPDDLTRSLQVVFGLVVVVINAVAYGWLWGRRFVSRNMHRPHEPGRNDK